MSQNLSQKEEYFLQMTLPYKEETVFEIPVQPNDTFYQEYVHSVELSTVKEYFQIDENYQIIATESWTQSFGAGLPYEKRDELEIKDGFMIIKQNRIIEHLHILPSHLFPHSFHIGEKTVHLSEQLNGERIRIEVVKK